MNASENAPMSEVEFLDIIESAQSTVEILQKKENVDLIIAISHTCISGDPSKAEDGILANNVPDIDIIISGHSHTLLEEPVLIKNTIIGASGEYGEYLGVIHISRNPNEDWELDEYKVIRMDDEIPFDTKIVETIDSFKNIVQDEYLHLCSKGGRG